MRLVEGPLVLYPRPPQALAALARRFVRKTYREHTRNIEFHVGTLFHHDETGFRPFHRGRLR